MRQVAAFIDEGVGIALGAKADLATNAAEKAEGGKPPIAMTNLKVLLIFVLLCSYTPQTSLCTEVVVFFVYFV